MSLFTVTDARSEFTLSDAAAAKIKSLIEQEQRSMDASEGEAAPELSLRVAVRPGGCSGFSYEMYFDPDVADDDTVAAHGGVQVVIDPASAPHLAGATLDYKDGLQGAGFHISNPNAQRTCGCGQSFS